jgi:mannosyltransferase
MALAFALGVFHAGTKSVVLDEAISDSYARESLGRFWQTVSHVDPNMSLYYLLLRPWVAVFGDSEAALRSLSAVFAALAVGTLAVLGRRLFDRATGLVAGLFLAMDAFFVQYAQAARSYTLVVLLVLLSSYFFVGELEQPSRANALGYVLSSALAVYAHYFASYVLLTQLVTLAAIRRREALTRRWALIGGSVIALVTPEIVFAARAGTHNIAWVFRPRLWDLGDLPVLLLYSRAIATTLVCLALYALAWQLRRRGAPAGGGWQIWFVTAWFAVPVLLAFAVSFSLPMFVPYYLLVALPGLLLAGAAGLVRLPSHFAAAVILLLLAAGMGKELHRWYVTPTNENYRSAIQAIRARAHPGDAIVPAPAYTEPAVSYYLRREGPPTPTVAEPSTGRTLLGTHAPRIWLVSRGWSPEIEGALARGYKRTMTQADVSGLSVILYAASHVHPRHS